MGYRSLGWQAVAVNVTAIAPTEPSYLTVYPSGATRPVASNLNLAPGTVIPNMVIVPVSAGGAIDVFNFAGATDVVVDVLGWFATGSDYTGVVPARLLETRSGAGNVTVDGQQQGIGALGPTSSVRLTVAGRAGLPATGVGSVVLNVTAIAPTAASFVTVYPAGAARPLASNLNTAPGRTLPNLVVVQVSDAGEVELYNEYGTVDLAVDLLGWLPTGATTFVPAGPARVLETRPGITGGTVDGLANGIGRIGADTTLPLQIAGRGGVPAAGAGAVALNVTAIDPTAPSFITVSPSGRPATDCVEPEQRPGAHAAEHGDRAAARRRADRPLQPRRRGRRGGRRARLVPRGAGRRARRRGARRARRAPHPTIENISLVWSLTGDTDRDSQVLVRYRPQGTVTWRSGMPLRRVPAGSGDGGFVWTYRHAGSLFDLQPGHDLRDRGAARRPRRRQRDAHDHSDHAHRAKRDGRRTGEAGHPWHARMRCSDGAEPGDIVLLAAGHVRRVPDRP